MKVTAKTTAFRPIFPYKTLNIHTSSLFPSGSSTKTIRSPCPALMVSTVKMAGCFTMFPWGSIPVRQIQNSTLAATTKPRGQFGGYQRLSNPSESVSPDSCASTLCPEHHAHNKAFSYNLKIQAFLKIGWIISSQLILQSLTKSGTHLLSGFRWKQVYPDRYWRSPPLLASAGLMLTARGICALAAL